MAFLLLTACQSLRPFDESLLHVVQIESRGVMVPATWVTPDSRSGDGWPVVIMAHGHGGTRDEAGGFRFVAHSLAEQGIASLRLDFPGCGDSVESFTQNYLSNMLEDLQAARAFAVSQSGVDSQRVGLLGFSMGARLAMLASAQSSYQALALWAPVGDDGAATMRRFVGGPDRWAALKADATTNGSTLFTTPWGQQQQLGLQWFIDLEQSKPLQAIAAFQGPVLVLYGGQDDVVAPELSASVAGHASNSRFVRAVGIVGADHGLGFYDGPARLGQKTVYLTTAFFDRHL